MRSFIFEGQIKKLTNIQTERNLQAVYICLQSSALSSSLVAKSPYNRTRKYIKVHSYRKKNHSIYSTQSYLEKIKTTKSKHIRTSSTLAQKKKKTSIYSTQSYLEKNHHPLKVQTSSTCITYTISGAKATRTSKKTTTTKQTHKY